MIVTLLIIVALILTDQLIKCMKRLSSQRTQGPQNVVIKLFKAVFTYPLDSYRARREARRNEPGPRHPEADDGIELPSLPRRDGPGPRHPEADGGLRPQSLPRRDGPGPRHPEADGGLEPQSLSRRRGSRSVPGTQGGVVAENQGSETNPEETDVDGTHGQDPRATTDDTSLTEPPAEAREFT